MYSIFGGKSRIKEYCPEGEPPPKRLISDGHILLKSLVKNQQKTQTTLSEQLNQEKQFISSESISNVTSHLSGESNLSDFRSAVSDVVELSQLRSKGLSEQDINLYKDYVVLGANFQEKYKNVNPEALELRLQGILAKADDKAIKGHHAPNPISRHQSDYLNSLKPQSVETQLLKFASQNEIKPSRFQSPMDELPRLEQELGQNRLLTSRDLKKIRKKARSFNRKIEELNEQLANNTKCSVSEKPISGTTLWDVEKKDKGHIKVENKGKVYSCEPPNRYTIKNGEIVKVNAKLTIEEIRRNPKFAKYEIGPPSKMVYLKNLHKTVSEDLLKSLTQNVFCTVKLMKGKMRGQAFIEFEDETRALDGLEALNGVLVEGRPIIAQFGKKT